MTEHTKVVVIGLDGATWDLIKPWADKGEIPTFKKLMDNGVWGDLESTIPPVTGPAWVSFSTGKNPGKHGIFDFVYLENNRLKLHTSRDVKSKTFYEILSMEGLRNIIISLPLSFPPKSKFNGIMVSDFLYPKKEIYPLSKKGYIENYKVIPDLSKKGYRLLSDIIDTIKKRIQLAKNLFSKEKWDFYFLCVGETDSILHHFWKDITHNTKIGQSAKKVFYIADEFLDWLLDQMDEKTILFIMSDHGFTSYPHTVNLNKILLDKELLKTKIKEKKIDETLGRHIMEAFGGGGKKKEISLPEPFFKVVSHPVMKPLSKRIFKWIFKDREINYVKGVDFEASKAFVPTSESMSIYINRKIDENERECIVENIIKILNDLKYNGQKVFKYVLRKNEVYSGPFVKLAPDILLIPNGFYITSGFSDKVFDNFKMGAFHDQKGIFLAYGKGIKKGQRIDPKIYDIAPTILHIFGLPIPNDMNGRVLMEIFEEDSEFAGRKPKYVDPSYYEKGQEDEKIKKALKKAIKNLKLKGKI